MRDPAVPGTGGRGAAVLAVVAALLATGSVFAQAPVAPGQMPALPLTQLDERGPAADLDARRFSLTFAQPVPVRDLLLLLVRGTSLSLVPDPAVDGTFIGELKNVTVREALEAILPPLGLAYAVDAGVVHVFARARDTRIFDVNYLAAERTGRSTVGSGPDTNAVSTAAVSTTVSSDVFDDLLAGVRTLLSAGAAFNLDRRAGLLQVTDYAERLQRVGEYLDAVADRVHRQVEFDARIVEVALSDEEAAGLDWRLLSSTLSGTSPAPAAARRYHTALRVTDVERLLAALAEQGQVATLHHGRVTVLNNEPAIVRSDALTVAITPQIAPDGVVTVSLVPVMKTPAIAESDTVARVADGETLVISGFPRTRETRERGNFGFRGGWFGRRTVVTTRRVELLILLTPRVL